MASCLVLGGAGFLGSHLVDGLKAAGHQVRIFDRPHEFLDPADLERALPGAELVFHLISTTVPKNSNENPALDIESNIAGTARLLELLRKHPPRRLVFISSGGTVYGVPRATPIRESHPTDPISSYGIHKLAIEKYLHMNHALYGLDYRVLRVANAYGERQRTDKAQGAVAAFLERVLRNEPIQIWGDGSVVRDYVYAGDIAQSFLRAAEYRGEERIFNIGSGHGVSLNELVDAIAAVIGRRPSVEYTPGRGFDVPVNVLDIRLAREKLGWSPQMPLAEGLRRTYEWMRRCASS
jgi:UDP-glucose 4-epimerase